MESVLDVPKKPRLIVLHGKEIVPPFFRDVATQITLAEHGVPRNDVPLQHQPAKQRKSRFALVRLLTNFRLHEGQTGTMCDDGQQVDRLPMWPNAAAGRFTVDGNWLDLAASSRSFVQPCTALLGPPRKALPRTRSDRETARASGTLLIAVAFDEIPRHGSS